MIWKGKHLEVIHVTSKNINTYLSIITLIEKECKQDKDRFKFIRVVNLLAKNFLKKRVKAFRYKTAKELLKKIAIETNCKEIKRIFKTEFGLDNLIRKYNECIDRLKMATDEEQAYYAKDLHEIGAYIDNKIKDTEENEGVYGYNSFFEKAKGLYPSMSFSEFENMGVIQIVRLIKLAEIAKVEESIVFANLMRVSTLIEDKKNIFGETIENMRKSIEKVKAEFGTENKELEIKSKFLDILKIKNNIETIRK